MNKSNQIDMLNGPLMGKLVRFAIPFAASSILQQLFNSVHWLRLELTGL